MIWAKGLELSFGAAQVLKGVDLELKEGESCALIGASGSGKSVLMRCILGLLQPTSGQTSDLEMSNTGVLFQGGALFDSMPIWANVAFRHLQQGWSKSKAKALAIEKLARVELDDHVADQFPSALSGGMQKRAALARAIAHDPAFLVFDEPTTGLDPLRAKKISVLIREIVKDTGATALTVTHDMACVHTIADTVAFLNDGQIHWRGEARDLTSVSDPLLSAFTAAHSD